MEHQRIDEGVKRGPQHQHLPAIRPIEGDSWTIPEGLDPDAILEEYLVEAQTSRIAVRLGIRRRALTRWLQKERPQEWKEVQRIRALCTKEDGTEMIYDARDALQLARARELVRVASFDLQALDPDYHPKQDVTHHASGPLIQINVVPIPLGATVGATAITVLDESIDNQPVKQTIR